MRILCSCALVLALLGSSTVALEPGEIGVYFDDQGTSRRLGRRVVGVPFSIHVLTRQPPGDVLGFELGLELHDELFVLYTTVTHPCVQVDCGWGQGPENWSVFLGSCHAAEGALSLLAAQLMQITPINQYPAPFCVGPFQSAIEGPVGPRYLTCGDRQLRNFDLTPAQEFAGPGCAVIHPYPDPVSRDTLSMLKARY